MSLRRMAGAIGAGMLMLAAPLTVIGGDSAGAASTILYVSNTGTDSGACMTAATPCATVSYALTQDSSPDDTVLASGTIDDNIVINSRTVEITQDPGGSPAVIDGMGTGPVITTEGSTVLTVNQLTLTGGSAPDGGGVVIDGGSVSISDSTISGNTATSAGGGIIVSGGLNLIRSTVSGNAATGSGFIGGMGGGIVTDSGGSAYVVDSTISGNTAGGVGSGAEGGGVMNQGGSQSISNSTISGNTATGPNGGGGGVSDLGGGILITDSTISGNSATGYGAAIENTTSSLQVAGDILADAGGPPAVDECHQSPPSDWGYNVDDDGTCGLSGANHSVSDSATIGAYLGPLQNNGGSTDTIALSSGATNPAQAVIPLTFTPPLGSLPACRMVDQRAVGRATPCDMGAFALTVAAPWSPTNLAATLGVGQADLSWIAPSSGGPFVSYTVSGNDTTTSTVISPVTVTGTPPATSTPIAGLTPGDAYTFTVTATNATGPEVASTPLAALLPAPFFPVAPSRICDTRNNGNSTQCVGKTLAAGGTLKVRVTGNGGVPAGATAVVANVTATGATAQSFLTAYPDGSTRPLASNLNFSAGQSVPNLVTVPLSSGGALDLYNALGSVNALVDVDGYYGPGSGEGFTSLAPSRICDTRNNGNSTQCVNQTLSAGGTLKVQVTGNGGVPAGATAVVANVTATGPTAASFLTAYANGAPRPLASNLNFTTGETVPNRVIVPLSSGGALDLYNALGSVNAIVDVSGYFNGNVSGYFEPVAPSRICDTRNNANTTPCVNKTLAAGGTLDVQVTGNDGIPSGAAAVVANVTATGATAQSFLTVYPEGASQPTASDLNFSAGQTVPNLCVAKLSSAGGLAIYNAFGSVNALVDVAGWFTS